MSVPANFQTAIDSQSLNIGRWLEIEGIPYGYGNFTADDTFFNHRALIEYALLGIKPYLIQIPQAFDQQINTLDGGALSAGAIEFVLGDIDGSITQFMGLGYSTGFSVLTAEMATAAVGAHTTIHTSQAAYQVGDYVYIGTETVKIFTVVSSTQYVVARGKFRSTPQAFGIGIPVGTRPYTMANRRCWYHQVAAASQTPQLFTADNDDDKCVRVAGVLKNMTTGQAPNTWTLSIQTLDSEIDRKIFRNPRSFKVPFGIMDAKGQGGGIQVEGWPGASVSDTAPAHRINLPLWIDGAMFANGEKVLMMVDREIFELQYDGTSKTGTFLARALLGTDAVKHDAGAIANELMCVIENDTIRGMQECSKFTIGTRNNVHGDHPLALALQFLVSTGTGSNGVYDVLPEEWGLGIDKSRIDVAGIEQVMQEEPSLQFGGIISKPINFISLLRELLAFAGYYYYIELGDLLRIRRLRPPSPDEPRLTIINASSRSRGTRTTWEANWTGAVREIIFSFGYDIINDKYKRIIVFEVPSGELYSKGCARTLEYESHLLYPGHSGIPGEPPLNRFDVDDWLLTRADFFRVRYGRPPAIIHEALTYDFLSVEVGDLVVVTNASIPSTTTGALGMLDEVGEVIGKNIDDKNKIVNLTLLMTGYQLGTYRYIAPSLKITAADNSSLDASHVTTLTFEPNEFTPATGFHGNAQTDLILDTQNGQVNAFPLNHLASIRLWNEDFTAYTDGMFTSFPDSNHGVLQFPGDPDFTPAANQYITYTSYPHFVAVTEALIGERLDEKYAFGADASDKLDSTDDPDRYFPT